MLCLSLISLNSVNMLQLELETALTIPQIPGSYTCRQVWSVDSMILSTHTTFLFILACLLHHTLLFSSSLSSPPSPLSASLSLLSTLSVSLLYGLVSVLAANNTWAKWEVGQTMSQLHLEKSQGTLSSSVRVDLLGLKPVCEAPRGYWGMWWTVQSITETRYRH